MSKIEIAPICFVSNHITELVDENWGTVVSRLRIKPEYSKGIKDIRQFSNAIVVTFLNHAQCNPTKEATVPEWMDRLMQNYF